MTDATHSKQAAESNRHPWHGAGWCTDQELGIIGTRLQGSREAAIQVLHRRLLQNGLLCVNVHLTAHLQQGVPHKVTHQRKLHMILGVAHQIKGIPEVFLNITCQSQQDMIPITTGYDTSDQTIAAYRLPHSSAQDRFDMMQAVPRQPRQA